jgi:hypothetical protein
MPTSGPPPPPVGVQANNLQGQSKWYVVIISSTRYGTVQAWLPDSIQIVAKSSWGPIVGNYESALANWIAPSVGNTPAVFFSKKLTAQAWRGVEPLQLVLQLHFFATEDASMEVIEPIKRLLKMSLPRQIAPESSFFGLQAPGPIAAGFDVPNFVPGTEPPNINPIPIPIIGGIHIGGGGKEDEDIINVYIGNFLALKEVFIDDIPGIEFSAKLSKDGLPMEGRCVVKFKTVYAPTSQDIDTYLGIAPLGGGTLGDPTGRPNLG